MKAQKLSWFDHEHRLTYDRMVKNYMSANQYLQDGRKTKY